MVCILLNVNNRTIFCVMLLWEGVRDNRNMFVVRDIRDGWRDIMVSLLV